MFGADTALVMDALQIAALAVAAGAGSAWLILRRRTKRNVTAIEQNQAGTLEERVRVLERIATDQPRILAEEIEALRDTKLETN